MESDVHSLSDTETSGLTHITRLTAVHHNYGLRPIDHYSLALPISTSRIYRLEYSRLLMISFNTGTGGVDHQMAWVTFVHQVISWPALSSSRSSCS